MLLRKTMTSFTALKNVSNIKKKIDCYLGFRYWELSWVLVHMEISLPLLRPQLTAMLTLSPLHPRSRCTPSSRGAWSWPAWPPPAVAGWGGCCCIPWRSRGPTARWASAPVSSSSPTLKPTVLTWHPSCGPAEQGGKHRKKGRVCI